MNRSYFVFAAALALAACARSMPPMERYRITPVHPGGKNAERGSGSAPGRIASRDEPRRPLATLRIEPYVTEGIYADPQIDYRTGEAQYGAYPNREWALPLSTMLSDLTAEVVRSAAGRRVRVVNGTEAGAAEYVWRGAVREFEKVSRGEDVLVAVHLEGALVRARDDSLLWQGAARGERPVPADSMPAVVAALSALGTETVTTMVRDAAGAVLRGAVLRQ